MAKAAIDNTSETKGEAAQSATDKVSVTTHKSPSKHYSIDMEPKLVDLQRLYARDNSGGPDFQSDTGNFGDGGDKNGQGIGA